MTEEYLDVVDSADEIIGRRSRSDVHATGLRHRSVHVLVFNRSGRLFLQKRSLEKETHPGLWDSSASGHLNSGEDYDTGAIRELGEEIGLFLERVPERLFKVDACDETGQEFVWVYRVVAEGPFRLQPGEIDDGDWFDLREVENRLKRSPGEFAPSFALIWRLMNERSNRPISTGSIDSARL